MAEIYNYETGDTLSEGIQGSDICNDAINCARDWADRLGEAVQLDDDDGEWVIFPRTDGKRPPAKLIRSKDAEDDEDDEAE